MSYSVIQYFMIFLKYIINLNKKICYVKLNIDYSACLAGLLYQIA